MAHLTIIKDRLQFGMHRRTGIQPGFGASRSDYGRGIVFTLRIWWSALTISWMRKLKPAKA